MPAAKPAAADPTRCSIDHRLPFQLKDLEHGRRTSLPADMADELTVESHAPYMKIWAILAVLTAVEYFYALIFKDHFPVLVLGLVSLALVKAGMVGWFFMHLKFERKWVYILIIPACVMAVFLTLALVPTWR